MTGISVEIKREHYSVQDMAKRWIRYPISCSTNDLLNLGVEGLIQFSVLKDVLPNIKSIKSTWHYYSGGTLTECNYSNTIGSAKYIKLTRQTIADLAANPDHKTKVDMYPWCTFCPINRHPSNCLVAYGIKYKPTYLEALEEEEIYNLPDSTFCRIEDLLVTHDEITRFEESFEKALNPPFLDKEHPYFCDELAISVETWREIFEFQRVDPLETCKLTAWTYATDKYSFVGGDYDGGTGSGGRIATMLNRVSEKEFNKFKIQRK